MLDISALILIGVLIFSLFALKFDLASNFLSLKSTYQTPNGPRAWPIIGNLLQIVKNPHLKFSEWAVKYGKLYTVYLGNKQAMVISDPKLMKEVFRHSAATGTFESDTIRPLSQGPYGMLNSEGWEWTEQRQFFKRSVVEFGFGSSRLEPLILAEIDEVNEWIEKQGKNNGGCVLLNDILKCATNNAMWTIVSGERLRIDDTKVVKLLDNYAEGQKRVVMSGLGFFPWLKYIAPDLSGYTDVDKAGKDIHQFINGHFEEHKKSLSEGSPRDVIDTYLEHVDNTTTNGKKSSPFYDKIGHINSISTIAELFYAGGESSSSTINFAIFYLSQHPEIQKQLLEEIDDVIGERDPCIRDRPRMLFLEGLILETLRLSSLVPLGIIHQLTEDLSFQNYQLPKGLLLIANIYHCHFDRNVWGDPEVFRPNRFLENPALKECVVPFQAGKRICPGEHLAREILFLFIAKIFQKWKVSPHPNISKTEYFSSDAGFLLLPKRLEVIMSLRNKSCN